MSEIDELRNELATLRQSHYRLRRILASIGLAAAVAILAGATATQMINGDVTISGLLKCKSLDVQEQVAVSGDLEVGGNLKAKQVSAANIEEMKKSLDDLSNSVSRLTSKTNDLVRVEVFTLEPDYGQFGRSPGQVEASHRFDVPKKDYKLLATFPSIQSPGFMKNIWADGRPRNDWAAGATTVFRCDVVEEGDTFLLKYGARWFDWGDDGSHRIRIRFVAVFARR